MLKHLSDKALRNETMIFATPSAFWHAPDVPMDGEAVSQFRNQCIGERRGLKELSRLVDQRRADLEARLAEQKQENNHNP